MEALLNNNMQKNYTCSLLQQNFNIINNINITILVQIVVVLYCGEGFSCQLGHIPPELCFLENLMENLMLPVSLIFIKWVIWYNM